MLPISFIKYLPDPLFENIDDAGQDLIDFIDNFMIEILDSILGIWYFSQPEQTAQITIEHWEQYLNIVNRSSKTIRQKRQQIQSAVAGHKKRGLWQDSVKIIIDIIAGGDSQILSDGTGSDWILTGDGRTPDTYYWATFGVDGIDEELGMDFIGEGTEVEIAGNIYIDVDNNALTTEQISQLVAELSTDVAPAYYRLFLGYINISDEFITYVTIE